MHDGEKIFLGPALASNPSAGNIFPWATNQAKNMHFEDGGSKTHMVFMKSAVVFL